MSISGVRAPSLSKQGYQVPAAAQREGISSSEVAQKHDQALAEHAERGFHVNDVVRVVGPNPGDLKPDGTIRKVRQHKRRQPSVVPAERAAKAKKATASKQPVSKQLDQIEVQLEQMEAMLPPEVLKTKTVTTQWTDKGKTRTVVTQWHTNERNEDENKS